MHLLGRQLASAFGTSYIKNSQEESYYLLRVSRLSERPHLFNHDLKLHIAIQAMSDTR